MALGNTEADLLVADLNGDGEVNILDIVQTVNIVLGIGKDKIPFISERNPTKVGLRCVGTDIELISEEKARSLKPKAMVVLPWYFKDEIVEREKQYINDGGELMFPMPYPHVVTKKAEIKL